MNLFRKKARPENETIPEFWQWWATARDDVAEAVSAGTLAKRGKEIERRVQAINPRLEWAVRRSSDSAHVLVVTPGWPWDTRAVAERWLAAAPPADETWSYRTVRVVADPLALESTRESGGHVVDLVDTRFGITVKEQLRQIDVVCYHPAFAGLTNDLQENMAHHSVEWTVGEDDALIWIDDVTWSTAEPAQPHTPAELREAVRTLADSLDPWQLWSTEWDGLPAQIRVAAPLRPERWPRFDMYVSIELPYQRYDEGKLPVDDALDALRRFENELNAVVGTDGTLVAQETFNRSRTLHFYVDSQTNARARLESCLPQWREREASTYVQLDPTFERTERFSQLGD